jgi:hypothetical protein
MPLERLETAEYIEHRMRCVGWEGDPKFNQSAYSLIHETTEGIPRQINALCNRILLRAYAEQKHYIDEGMVSRAIDDVQSEPLATNVPYQQALAETTKESFHESQRFGQEATVTHANELEHSVRYTEVDEQIAFPDNDQDETLPLPSAANHDTHPARRENRVREVSWSFAENNSRPVARGARNVSPGSGAKYNQPGVNQSSEDSDDEIDDEVRKMSDALSDFHSETATAPSNLKIPAQNTGQQYHLIPERGKTQPYVKKRTTDISRQTKPKRKWAAALAYGSIAFLFIAVGVFLWVYKFSNDVLGPLQAEGITNNSFLAAIKDMLPAQNIESATSGQSLGEVNGEVNNNSGSEVIVTEPVHGSTAETEDVVSPIAALPNSMLNPEEPVKGDTGSDEEHWDSGALGSQFLSAQAEQPSQPSEEPISGSEFSVAEVDEEAAKSFPDLNPQAAQATKTAPDKAPEDNPFSQTQVQPKETDKPNKSEKQLEAKIPNSQTVVASAVNIPKTNKSSESRKTALQNSKPKAANSPLKATTGPKNPVQTASAVQSATPPAQKSVTSKPVEAQPTTELSSAENSKPQKSPTIAQTQKPTEKKTTASSNVPKSRAPVSLSKNVVILNPSQVSPTEGAVEDINQLQLNALLDKLTAAYEKGNLQQLLSVLSKDIRSNDGSTRRDLKNGYRKLFNITDMRKMTISSVNWSKEDRLIHGKGEFRLSVREKGSDKVTAYGGTISLEVDDKGENAVITRLYYDYK